MKGALHVGNPNAELLAMFSEGLTIFRDATIQKNVDLLRDGVSKLEDSEFQMGHLECTTQLIVTCLDLISTVQDCTITTMCTYTIAKLCVYDDITRILFENDFVGRFIQAYDCMDVNGKRFGIIALANLLRDCHEEGFNMIVYGSDLITIARTWLENCEGQFDLRTSILCLMMLMWFRNETTFTTHLGDIVGLVFAWIISIDTSSAELMDAESVSTYILLRHLLTTIKRDKGCLREVIKSREIRDAVKRIFGNYEDTDIKKACIEIWKLMCSVVNDDILQKLWCQMGTSLFLESLQTGGVNEDLFQLFQICTKSQYVVKQLLSSNIMSIICTGHDSYSFEERLQCCKFIVTFYNQAPPNEFRMILNDIKDYLSPLLDLLESWDDDEVQTNTIEALFVIFQRTSMIPCVTDLVDELRSEFISLGGVEILDEHISEMYRERADVFIRTFIEIPEEEEDAEIIW